MSTAELKEYIAGAEVVMREPVVRVRVGMRGQILRVEFESKTALEQGTLFDDAAVRRLRDVQ